MGERELVRRLRTLRRQLKVVFMSGYGLAELEESQWPFAEKPFSTDALAQIVKAPRRGRETAIRPRPGDRI